MARKIRNLFVLQGSAACGATDATPVLVLGPDATASVALASIFDNLTFLGAHFVQRAAGTGTGTFAVNFVYGSGNTLMSNVSAATFIDADAAVGTIHGFFDAGPGIAIPTDQQIKIVTTKTGTVSANATLAITLIFAISGSSR